MRPSLDPRRSVRFAIVAVILLALFVLPAGFRAETATGRCVSAETTADVILPDGSTHPAGRIQICMTLEYSPVAGLHTTRLADGFAAMFLSDRRQSEGVVEDGRPYIQFFRARGGEWILDAYAVPQGDRMQLFQIKPIGRSAKAAKGPEAESRLALNEDGQPQVVQLVASLR